MKMKKKDFVTLIMSTVGGILFALGMCMALIPEWGAMRPGIVVGAVGAVVLHDGLDGESVYPRGGHRRRWDCGGSRRLSAFQRHYEEGAGAAGTADSEADGGAVEGGVRAARFRLYNG